MRAGDRDLGVVDRQRAVGVVDGERAPRRGPAAARPDGAGEDDVLHLAAAQRLGALLAHHPGQGVDDVGLARPVGPDDAGDAGLEVQGRRGREGLEALEGQALQMHGAKPTRWSCSAGAGPGSIMRASPGPGPGSALRPGRTRWTTAAPGRSRSRRGPRPAAGPPRPRAGAHARAATPARPPPGVRTAQYAVDRLAHETPAASTLDRMTTGPHPPDAWTAFTSDSPAARVKRPRCRTDRSPDQCTRPPLPAGERAESPTGWAPSGVYPVDPAGPCAPIATRSRRASRAASGSPRASPRRRPPPVRRRRFSANADQLERHRVRAGGPPEAHALDVPVDGSGQAHRVGRIPSA